MDFLRSASIALLGVFFGAVGRGFGGAGRGFGGRDGANYFEFIEILRLV